MKLDPTLMYTITTKGNGENYYMYVTTKTQNGDEWYQYTEATTIHDILVPTNTTPYLAIKSGHAKAMVSGRWETIEPTPLSGFIDMDYVDLSLAK